MMNTFKPFWLVINGYYNRFTNVKDLTHFHEYPERLGWKFYINHSFQNELVFIDNLNFGITVREYLLAQGVLHLAIQSTENKFEQFYDQEV